MRAHPWQAASPSRLRVRARQLRRFLSPCDLLHHGADAFGLLKCVFHDLLQIKPISRGLRKLVAVLLDLAHVEQQRGQGPIQLSCDRGSRLIHRPCARGGQPDNFQIVVDGGCWFPATLENANRWLLGVTYNLFNEPILFEG
jgi:hypothetical protein